MTRREIVAEWMKGCSNTYPYTARPWWACSWCSNKFMRVFLGKATKGATNAFMSGMRRM